MVTCAARGPACLAVMCLCAAVGGSFLTGAVAGGEERQDGDSKIPHLPVGFQRVRH